MGLSFSERQVADLHAVVRILSEPAPLGELRAQLGYRLLDLFNADYFASYVHTDGGDSQAVTINMDRANIAAYQSYFQYKDPITRPMRQQGRAVHVNQVMDQTALERSEFFNDFLAADGLTHGMNFHARMPARTGGTHLGDLRIWRARRSGNFDQTDVQMLQIVGELYADRAARSQHSFTDGPIDAAFAPRYGLTRRETDVLRELCSGKTDMAIADALDISPETVRSHLKALFQKTGARRRTALVAMALPGTGDVAG